MEKNNVFAIPDFYVDLFEMRPILKEDTTAIEGRNDSVFLAYANCVGDIVHLYLQKTQFTALEGLKGELFKFFDCNHLSS